MRRETWLFQCCWPHNHRGSFDLTCPNNFNQSRRRETERKGRDREDPSFLRHDTSMYTTFLRWLLANFGEKKNNLMAEKYTIFNRCQHLIHCFPDRSALNKVVFCSMQHNYNSQNCPWLTFKFNGVCWKFAATSGESAEYLSLIVQAAEAERVLSILLTLHFMIVD